MKCKEKKLQLPKDCPLQELVLENSNIDAARVQTLAHAIVKQESAALMHCWEGL